MLSKTKVLYTWCQNDKIEFCYFPDQNSNEKKIENLSKKLVDIDIIHSH